MSSLRGILVKRSVTIKTGSTEREESKKSVAATETDTKTDKLAAIPESATTPENGTAAAAANTESNPTSSSVTSTQTVGKYTNWSSKHGALAAQSWCCIGDLIALCDKYEYKSLGRAEWAAHNCIVAEVKALLNGQAPFDLRKRFPGNIHSPENLWVCVGRCAAVEYHLNRILSVFRKPLEKLSADKQRMARQNFHLAINELRLDISARISEVRLYDRAVFEKDFQLTWQDNAE